MHHLSPVRWWCAWMMRYINGSRYNIFGWAMSIFARKTFSPSANSPARIRANKSKFSSTLRSRQGLFLPGEFTVPRLSRISSCVWSMDLSYRAAYKKCVRYKYWFLLVGMYLCAFLYCGNVIYHNRDNKACKGNSQKNILHRLIIKKTAYSERVLSLCR